MRHLTILHRIPLDQTTPPGMFIGEDGTRFWVIGYDVDRTTIQLDKNANADDFDWGGSVWDEYPYTGISLGRVAVQLGYSTSDRCARRVGVVQRVRNEFFLKVRSFGGSTTQIFLPKHLVRCRDNDRTGGQLANFPNWCLASRDDPRGDTLFQSAVVPPSTKRTRGWR